MITENLSTLKINVLSQKQYEREYEAGNLPSGELCLTPDETALPTPTEADNGKILMVVNGKYQLVAINLSIDDNGVVSMA